MALLLNLRKLMSNVLKNKHIQFCERSVSTTHSLWINKQFTRPSSFKEKEKRFLEKDRVPQNYNLIYKSSMESYVIWPMHVSTVTVSIIVTAAIYNIAVNQTLLEPTGTTLIMDSDDIYYFAAGFMAINTVLRLVVSMLPLRIYRDERKYLAVYHPQLPLGVSHHHFEKGQVKPVYYLWSPWNKATYKLGKKTSLLFDYCFKTPSEFHEMRDIDSKK